MPQIDVIDSTWIPAPAATVIGDIADAANWARWWPGLRLQVHEDRGEKGLRWQVPPGSSGTAAGLAGSAEVWLQPMFDGVVAHFFLRLDPAAGTSLGRRRARHVETFYRHRTKRAFWRLADRADPERLFRRPPPGVTGSAGVASRRPGAGTPSDGAAAGPAPSPPARTG